MQLLGWVIACSTVFFGTFGTAACGHGASDAPQHVDDAGYAASADGGGGATTNPAACTASKEKATTPTPPQAKQAHAWSVQLGATFEAEAVGEAVDVMPDGGAVVVFEVQGTVDIGGHPFTGHAAITQGHAAAPTLVMVRYDAAGAIQWSSMLESDQCGPVEWAPTVRVDRTEAIIVAGAQSSSGPVCILKFDPRGALVWSRLQDGYKGLVEMHLGADGAIALAQRWGNKSVTVLEPTGDVRWQAEVGVLPEAIAMQDDGTLYVVGVSPTDRDPTTMRAQRQVAGISRDGAVCWRKDLPNGASNDSPAYLASSGDDDAVVAWRSHGIHLAKVAPDGTLAPEQIVSATGIAHVAMTKDVGIVVAVQTQGRHAWRIQDEQGSDLGPVELKTVAWEPMGAHHGKLLWAGHLNVDAMAVDAAHAVLVGSFDDRMKVPGRRKTFDTECKHTMETERGDPPYQEDVRHCAWAAFVVSVPLAPPEGR